MPQINLLLTILFLYDACMMTSGDGAAVIASGSTPANVEVLVEQARSWAQHVGLHYRYKEHLATSYFAVLPPFTLFPTAIPRKMFEEAYAVQEALAELYFKVASDYKFLSECFKDVRKADETISKLMGLLDELQQEEIRQPIALQLMRSDYMFHTCEDCEVSQPTQLKQVEMNIGVGGSISEKATLLHQRIMAKAGIDPKLLPENKPNDTWAEGFHKAWQQFGDPNAIFLIIINQKYDLAHYEMRDLDYRLEELSDHKIRIVHLSPNEAYEQLRLANDHKLMLDDNVVGVVHFSTARLINPKFLTEKRIDLWRMVERSNAIKNPTIGMDLADSKKVQQALAEDGIVEKFFPDPKDAHKVEAIRKIQAGMWPLDRVDEKTVVIIKDAISHPGRYVLKPNREGGGHNYWDDELKSLLEKTKGEELGKFILMQRLRPLVTKNLLVQPMEADARLEEVVTELGVFGSLLGNLKTGKVLYNRGGGHLMRTKPKDIKEGGVFHGTGFFDSPILY